jgi:hypothetical protein
MKRATSQGPSPSGSSKRKGIRQEKRAPTSELQQDPGSELSPIQVELVSMLDLKRSAREEGKAYLALENEIWEASGRRKGMKIDRRKLSRMAADVPVTFTFSELQALDHYLAQKGMSLVQAFRRPTILESFGTARNRTVAFFLGSKPIGQFNFLSHWDARALAYLLRGIERSGQGILFDLEDIPLKPRDALGVDPAATFEGEPWRALVDDRPDSPSLCAIGSPRASHLSEFLLANLFQVRPFDPDASRSTRARPGRPPFLFIVPRRSFEEAPPSSFLRCSDEYPNRPPDSPNGRWGVGGLDVEGKLYWINWDEEEWDEYAIIAVGRRSTGQVWLYVGGASGPSTYAAAREIEYLTATLPQGPLGEDSPVLWGVVKVHVRREDSREANAPGDKRRVRRGREETQFYGPYLWPAPKAPDAARPGRPRKTSPRAARAVES